MKTSSRNRTSNVPVPPAVRKLVGQMQRDIASGTYRAGDAYLSVRDAMARFDVSLVTAHRAIRELARLGAVRVRRGSGAYVTRSSPAGPRARTLHVLMPDEPAMRERFVREGLQLGLMAELPSASMHLHFLTRDDALADVRSILLAEPAPGGSDLLGAVLVRVGRSVRQAFASRQIPAVVIGHSDDDIPLPSVGLNQRELGRRAAEALRARRRRHPVLIMRDEWDFGDNLLIEGLNEGFAEDAGPATGASALQIRSTPEDGELVRRVVERLIDERTPFDALLCRSNPIAVEAAAVLRARKKQDVTIVGLGARPRTVDTVDRSEILAVTSDDYEIGRLAAQLLMARVDPDGRPKRIDLPIEWRVPSQRRPG